MMPDAWQLGCASRTVYGEARGEGPTGMSAVAHVIVNRLNDGRWGHTLAMVCGARWQFSCWNEGDPNRITLLTIPDATPLLKECEAAVIDALSSGIDPTAGATHYYADSIAAPEWVQGAIETARIGHQVFFKGVK